MIKPDRITLLSNAAIAVGFALLLVGVGMMGGDSAHVARAHLMDRHRSHAPELVFWLGVVLSVGGCLARAWRF